MVYPHMLSISAASTAQLHTARMGVVWFQRGRLLRESKCDQEMKDRVLKEVIFQLGEYLTGQFRAEGIGAFCDTGQ